MSQLVNKAKTRDNKKPVQIKIPSEIGHRNAQQYVSKQTQQHIERKIHRDPVGVFWNNERVQTRQSMDFTILRDETRKTQLSHQQKKKHDRVQHPLMTKVPANQELEGASSN